MLMIIHDRPDLDTSALFQGRATMGQRGGLFQVFSLDNNKAPQLLPDLHKRSVSDDAACLKDLSLHGQSQTIAAHLSLSGDPAGPLLPFPGELLEILRGGLAEIDIG